jgi:GlpG protein
MSEIKVLEVPLEEDLEGFSVYLWRQGITHRIHEQSGKQQLDVGDAEQAEQVQHYYKLLKEGELEVPRRGEFRYRQPSVAGSLRAPLRNYPLTLAFICLSVLGYLVVSYDRQLGLLHHLSFTDFELVRGRQVFESWHRSLADGEYWRLFSPALLHFGLLHLAFNMLWFWELGRRIEMRQGAGHFLGLVFFTGMGGNIAQYLHSTDVLFGGMSGVIYGLLGYCWVWSSITGDRTLAVHKSVLIFMIGLLFVLMTGVTEVIPGFGGVANAAHFFGLVFGMVMGAASALLVKGVERNK